MPCFARPLFVKEGLKSLSEAVLVEREVGFRSACRLGVVTLVELVGRKWPSLTKPFHNPFYTYRVDSLEQIAHIKLTQRTNLDG